MADNTQAQKEAVKRYQQQSESWTVRTNDPNRMKLLKAKNDSEKAKALGVDKSVYSRCHAPVFDAVFSEIFKPISKADDLARLYWRECKLT